MSSRLIADAPKRNARPDTGLQLAPSKLLVFDGGGGGDDDSSGRRTKRVRGTKAPLVGQLVNTGSWCADATRFNCAKQWTALERV